MRISQTFLVIFILSTIAYLGSDIERTKAQVPLDLSCAFFSSDPQDTSGPPIYFLADMSAEEESAVTESPGIGRADFELNRGTLEFKWRLTYRDLTSEATGIHIHGPQTPGGEAGIVVDMAPAGIKNPLEGVIVLSEGELIYLVQDRMYVNLHTTNYPGGELRGQVLKRSPDC